MSQEEHPIRKLDLWAGVECTINRVGNVYHQQLRKSGHTWRLKDLEQIAALGVKTVRYPVLWEQIAPEGLKNADWSFPDERLARLQELGIEPIAGLLHHGSGPRHTDLTADNFVTEFTRYAEAVAHRYPWLRKFTPINEPLTTGRFSGLYGFWYPHRRDDRTFVRALINQCRAIITGMAAIRSVIPEAELIQTEDLAKIHSVKRLAYQAEWENERRWLSYDLLMGKVDQQHYLYNYLLTNGTTERELRWFGEHAFIPAVMGFNYYLSSERFLDDALQYYPEHVKGGNGKHRYADVEIVRVHGQQPHGAYRLLREAWERFGAPLALTECHNGCTREEQMRWFLQVWKQAERLLEEGIDIRAVTAWAAFGTYDWHKLVTTCEGRYEPGIFDMRFTLPHATAMSKMLRKISAGEEPRHPVLESKGWWELPTRFQFGRPRKAFDRVADRKAAVPLIITGATGTLGRAFDRISTGRGLEHRTLRRQEMDIADVRSVEAAIERYKPWAIVNTAGYVRVDDAETESDRCFRENREGAAILAEACARHGIRLLTFSSDLVFNGEKKRPYIESDKVMPANVYGRSKAEAEKLVLAAMPDATVVRTSAFFGPWDEHNFLAHAFRQIRDLGYVVAAGDAVVSPTYVPDLVHACLDLIIDGHYGIWHLSNDGEVTWADFARTAADLAGFATEVVRPVSCAEMGLPALRPAYSALGSERSRMMPSLEDAIRRYVAHHEDRWRSSQPNQLGHPLASSLLPLTLQFQD